MANFRQPIGTIFGKFLNLHQLPIKKDAKDAIFRALEVNLNALSYVLAAAKGIRASCAEPIGEKTGFDDEVTLPGDPQIGDEVALPGNPRIGDEVALPGGPRLAGEVVVAGNPRVGDEVTLPERPQIGDDVVLAGGPRVGEPTAPGRAFVRRTLEELGEGGPELVAFNRTCCFLKPPSAMPSSQEAKFKLMFEIKELGVTIAKLQLDLDLNLQYMVSGDLEEIDGKCEPPLCTNETRGIRVLVMASGKISGTFTAIDLGELFGELDQGGKKVDLSALPGASVSSLDIDSGGEFGEFDPDGFPTGPVVNGKIFDPTEGISIGFELSLTDANETFGYTWRCMAGGRASLELDDPPYRFGPQTTQIGEAPPGTSPPADGGGGGGELPKEDGQAELNFVSARVTDGPIPTAPVSFEFNINGEKPSLSGRFNRSGNLELDALQNSKLYLGQFTRGCNQKLSLATGVFITERSPRPRFGGDNDTFDQLCREATESNDVFLRPALGGTTKIEMRFTLVTKCIS